MCRINSRGAADDMFARLAARKNVFALNEDMTQKNFYERPCEVLRVNLLSLINFLEWCTPQNCGAFLF